MVFTKVSGLSTQNSYMDCWRKTASSYRESWLWSQDLIISPWIWFQIAKLHCCESKILDFLHGRPCSPGSGTLSKAVDATDATPSDTTSVSTATVAMQPQYPRGKLAGAERVAESTGDGMGCRDVPRNMWIWQEKNIKTWWRVEQNMVIKLIFPARKLHLVRGFPS